MATAVQTAVQAAVKEATETVLRELLTGAAALPALAAAMTPVTPKATLSQRFGNACQRLWRKTTDIVIALPTTIRRSVAEFGRRLLRIPGGIRRATMNQATRIVATLTGMFLIAWRLRRTMPFAVTAGLGAAALAYTATPELAAALHGATIAALTIMARLVLPVPLPRYGRKPS